MLDRDGAIIPDRDYTSDAAFVSLLPGAAAAIRRLESAGYPSIVVTNQSGIARGLVSLEQYHAVRSRLAELLLEEDAKLLDTFSCPHHPDFTGACECRKPATGLYERAASIYELDLKQCVFIGDRTRDIAPAVKFGARAALVKSPHTADEDIQFAHNARIEIVESLSDAVDILLAASA